MKATALLLPAALFACRTLSAQAGPPASALADWQRDRANVLAYVDAMPESALTFRPTPGVRTFAEQIDHIVATNVDVAALTLRGLAQSPQLGDSTRYLHNKAALHAFAAATYDYVLAAMREAVPAMWSRRAPMYGQPPEVPARWLELSHEHSIWTLGQVVPYLRLNHVTPPSYQIPL
jgi:hypothetical protein